MNFPLDRIKGVLKYPDDMIPEWDGRNLTLRHKTKREIGLWGRFKRVRKEDYMFKFMLKFPERFLVGIVSGLTVYLLITLLFV